MRASVRVSAPARDPQAVAEASATAMWAGDRASQHLGMTIVEVSPGRAVLTMRIGDTMVNGHGIAHGGYLFTLADSAFAFACNGHGPDAVAAQPVLGPYFRAKGLDPTRLPYSLMTSDISPLLAPDGGAINTIDMPILEFEMARLRNRGIAAFKRRLRDHLSYADIARALGPGRAADRAAQTGFLQTLLEDSTLVRRWSDLAGR